MPYSVITDASVVVLPWKSKLSCFCVLVGEAVEAATRELLAQGVVDPLAVAEHAGGEELDHHQVAVAVHHQAGQAVAFAVHHAPGVGHRVELQHLTAQRHRWAILRENQPASTGTFWSVSRMRTAMRECPL
jgi:hypothetical protein